MKNVPTKEAVLADILRKVESMDGQAGFYYKDLYSGEEAGFRSDDRFLAASVIKLPLMAAILLLRSRGEASFRDMVTIRDDQKVPGCGAVQHMTGTVTLDVESLGKLMLTISDNTATNALFRYCGAARIRDLFADLGLSGSRLNRPLWDLEKEAQGINNYFVPREMGELLEKMYRHTLVDAPSSVWLEEVLKQQQIGHKLGGRLPMEFPIAHKTGDESDKAHDVGVVYAKEPFVACFAYVGPEMRDYEDLIRRATYELVQVHGGADGRSK